MTTITELIPLDLSESMPAGLHDKAVALCECILGFDSLVFDAKTSQFKAGNPKRELKTFLDDELSKIKIKWNGVMLNKQNYQTLSRDLNNLHDILEAKWKQFYVSEYDNRED